LVGVAALKIEWRSVLIARALLDGFEGTWFRYFACSLFIGSTFWRRTRVKNRLT